MHSPPCTDNTIRKSGKITTDQIYTSRQILEKTKEYNITNHHLFIDFKAAYDSIDIAPEKVIQDAGINTQGTIFQ
jgi:hypothetical protein